MGEPLGREQSGRAQEVPIDQCRSCTAPVIWGRTQAGRWMPVDAQPSPSGTVRLSPGSGAPLTRPGQSGPPRVPPRATVLPAKLAFGVPGLRTPHWASCPHADAHRRPERRNGTGRRAGGRR